MLGPIFGLTLLTGFVFIVIWAARFATKHQLVSVISWFLAIGIIGTLLSGTLSGLAFRRLSSLRPGFGSMLRDGSCLGGPNGVPAKASSASSVARKK